MNNKFVNIIIDTKGVVFLCLVIGLLVGAKSVTASLVSTERSPFFIGVGMRTCEIENCNRNHYGKGLCLKHYNKQWRENNLEYCLKRDKQYRQKYKKRIKQYRIDNREHILEHQRQYQRENKERLAKHKKRYALEHKEKIAKRKKRYRQTNKEKIKQYQENNKEHRAKYRKEYRKTLAGKQSRKAYNHNRRGLTKGLTKKIIQCVYEANLAKHGVLTCYLCNKPIINNDDCLEHSTPLTRKGTNNFNNLGIAHQSCNNQKGVKTLNEYRNEICQIQAIK